MSAVEFILTKAMPTTTKFRPRYLSVGFNIVNFLLWTTKDLFLQRILPNLCYHCVLQQVYFAWNCREVVHTPRVWSSSHSSFAKIVWWWRWGRAMVLLSERFQWMTWHLYESPFKCQVYSSAPLTQKYCLLGCFIPCRSAKWIVK